MAKGFMHDIKKLSNLKPVREAIKDLGHLCRDGGSNEAIVTQYKQVMDSLRTNPDLIKESQIKTFYSNVIGFYESRIKEALESVFGTKDERRLAEEAIRRYGLQRYI